MKLTDNIEEFDWARNMSRVAVGWKGSPYFNNPQPLAAMDIGGDWPEEVLTKLHASKVPEPTPTNPWVVRMHANS